MVLFTLKESKVFCENCLISGDYEVLCYMSEHICDFREKASEKEFDICLTEKDNQKNNCSIDCVAKYSLGGIKIKREDRLGTKRDTADILKSTKFYTDYSPTHCAVCGSKVFDMLDALHIQVRMWE